jgi:Domain of unknown function (DUF4157)
MKSKNHIQKKRKETVSSAQNKAENKAVYHQDNRPKTVLQKKNNTGLPDQLKSGIENLSGHSMDDVKVHYNSSAPAQLNAHAYAQGTDIHVAPGQEKHVPHEAWHVVQQKEGRVKPTKQLKSKVNINDDVSLEKEADVMGAKAMQMRNLPENQVKTKNKKSIVQRVAIPMMANGLTLPMQERFNTAFAKFNTAILSKSILAQGPNNHVVIYGVSQGTHGMKNYGATSIYIGQDGYQGNDYNKFTEIWQWQTMHKDIHKDSAVRIVITVNMTANASIEELYNTLLHEWYIHAVHWTGLITYIRNEKGRFATAWIQGQGVERRAAGEHKAYANMSDEDIGKMVGSLDLTKEESLKVHSKMLGDRNRHDKITGEAK